MQTSIYIKGHSFNKAICSSLPVSQSVPVYPVTQLQIYSLTPSVQFPPFSQGLGMQSLTSKTRITQRILIKIAICKLSHTDTYNEFLYSKCEMCINPNIKEHPYYNTVCISLPVSQSVPVYPEIQVQLYSLTPSVQFPLFSQGLGIQSFTSKGTMTQRLLVKIRKTFTF